VSVIGGISEVKYSLRVFRMLTRSSHWIRVKSTSLFTERLPRMENRRQTQRRMLRRTKNGASQ